MEGSLTTLNQLVVNTGWAFRQGTARRVRVVEPTRLRHGVPVEGEAVLSFCTGVSAFSHSANT